MANPKKPPRMEKTKYGTYCVIWHNNGRQKQFSLRTEDLRTAENRFAGWLQKVRSEETIDTDPYVGDCLDIWFDQWIKGQMLSEIRYPSVIRNLKKYFGNKRVSEVNRDHAKEYRILREQTNEIGRGKCSQATTRHELQKLRACFRFMAERVEPKERRISKSIIPYIDLPPPAPARNRVLTNEELQRLEEYCVNSSSNKFHNQGGYRKRSNRISKASRFLMLAMETAQRKSAILELKWEQVDLNLNLIRFLPYGKNQSIKQRPTVPISTKLKSFLDMIIDQKINNYVCDSPSDIHYQVSVISHQLDIPGLSPHVLRHTWATRKIIDGHPIEKVAEFLGDNPDTVRENYMHLTPDYLRSVVD